MDVFSKCESGIGVGIVRNKTKFQFFKRHSMNIGLLTIIVMIIITIIMTILMFIRSET